jgi:hypothetical protein
MFLTLGGIMKALALLLFVFSAAVAVAGDYDPDWAAYERYLKSRPPAKEDTSGRTVMFSDGTSIKHARLEIDLDKGQSYVAWAGGRREATSRTLKMADLDLLLTVDVSGAKCAKPLHMNNDGMTVAMHLDWRQPLEKSAKFFPWRELGGLRKQYGY